jgi:hypothetical protein
MSTPSSLHLETDASPGDWLVRAVGPFGSGVGSLVPPVFKAYARILHPAGRGDPAVGGAGPRLGRGSPVHWAAVAEWSGGVIHSCVQFEALARPRAGTPLQAPPFDAPPPSGNLPPPLLAALLDLLRQHTTTPDRCWFGLWEGCGWVQGSPAVGWLAAEGPRPPRHRRPWPRQTDPPDPGLIPPALGPESRAAQRVRLPERDYLLFSGPLGAALQMGWRRTDGAFDPQSPNLIWPDDRAWFVATEIDLDSTYLGGSAALIEAVLANQRLESVSAQPSDDVSAASDDVNG